MIIKKVLESKKDVLSDGVAVYSKYCVLMGQFWSKTLISESARDVIDLVYKKLNILNSFFPNEIIKTPSKSEKTALSNDISELILNLQ